MALNWNCPYPSNRSPVFAKNLVATSQPLAVQAGINTLKSGGNAVDAAIATAITLTVVEPNNNGIGSDAFAIIWDGETLHGLNASGRSPAALSKDRFKGQERMPTLGWDAVTVPGAVSAWVEMSSRFGNVPFAQLFDDAINYATHGFQVGPKTSFYWQSAEERFKDFTPFMDTFMIDGKAPAAAEVMRLPDHAATLNAIAESKGDAFYQGALAHAMIDDSNDHGGTLCMKDLIDHRCDWVGTISAALDKTRLHEIPPNGQGLMALIGLGILDRLDIARVDLDSALSLHLQIEAIRIAYAQIERHLADIDHMRVQPAQLLNDEFLSARASEISLTRANPTPTVFEAGSDTVYLTTADASGMMVSMIQSNFRGFGSGIVIPGTGISMQNRGSGFILEEDHPNQVGGGKRPYQTIIPGFVMENGAPRMSFGVMGGHMQAQGHLQMMLRIFVHQQNPQAASDAPRWHLREDGKVLLEAGISSDVSDDLSARGHDIILNAPEHNFGGAQLIYRMRDGYCGGSDHRKEGLVAGF
ncbi:MAG: gamma-glutamyltransferase family protein [Proteobacteria bacterium]|nr:gamma-glutamyltransferase family protein [Pseudomonadota bacterium]